MAPLSHDELAALAVQDVAAPLPEAEFRAALLSPPFVAVPGLFNLRDLGTIPGTSSSGGSSGVPPAIRPARIYRAAALDAARADPDAAAWLTAHVRRIFDLRTADERARRPSPVVDGVETVWHDVQGSYGAPSLADFCSASSSDPDASAAAAAAAWRDQYLTTLAVYRPAIRAVLEHVRDRPAEPFLFHCAAGRDRTGVVAGLLEGLAGASPDVLAFDYTLSRIGTEPARDLLLGVALAAAGATDPETPGFYDYISLRPAYWRAFMDGLQSEYGGWDGYVTKGLGFSSEDLERIKRNLRA